MGLTVVILVVMLLLVVPFLFTTSCFYKYKNDKLYDKLSKVSFALLIIALLCIPTSFIIMWYGADNAEYIDGETIPIYPLDESGVYVQGTLTGEKVFYIYKYLDQYGNFKIDRMHESRAYVVEMDGDSGYMLAKKKVMFKDTFLEEETSSVVIYALVIPVGTYGVI